MNPERMAFLTWVLSQEGVPYCWPAASNNYLGKGLRGDPKKPEALDCSGTVSSTLRAAKWTGAPPTTHTASTRCWSRPMRRNPETSPSTGHRAGPRTS